MMTSSILGNGQETNWKVCSVFCEQTNFNSHREVLVDGSFGQKARKLAQGWVLLANCPVQSGVINPPDE